MGSKLKELSGKCACGVYLEVNKYRDYYQTAEEALDEIDADNEIDLWVREKILETGNLVELHFFPNTPNGSYRVIHWDVDGAVEMGLEILRYKEVGTPDLKMEGGKIP